MEGGGGDLNRVCRRQGECERGRGDRLLVERVDMTSVSRFTSARRASISSGEEGVMADRLGGAPSMILSANSAISSRLLSSPVAASNMRTFEGSRCRKS